MLNDFISNMTLSLSLNINFCLLGTIRKKFLKFFSTSPPSAFYFNAETEETVRPNQTMNKHIQSALSSPLSIFPGPKPHTTISQPLKSCHRQGTKETGSCDHKCDRGIALIGSCHTTCGGLKGVKNLDLSWFLL